MIKVYDLDMQLVAYLENAFNIGYETPLNALRTASFSLPADDGKNAECLPLCFVEIFDGADRVDLFRIIPMETQRDDGPTITYHLEHVLATLLDDVLFQYHQVGGVGVGTADSMQYILNQQTTQRWQLGTVAFAHQFEYKWENDNLLGALFSVPKPFLEAYQWTWDTSSYPWTLNLVEAETEVSAYVRYGKNLKGIKKTEDPTNLVTRIYPLGYGEGVNQLTIRDVNNGVPYLDASTSVVNGGQYPIIARPFVDRRYESAGTLKARAQALLEELKLPRMTYEVEAAELYRLTNDPVDKFRSGAQVRVIDEELGIDVITRVVNVRKPDVEGAPGDVQIEIANRPEDIAGSISGLESRQRINEVYAQGATNIYTHDFADNCDPANPAIIKFFVPAETVRINKLLLTYKTEQFRAYSKATKAGGATVVSSEDGNWHFDPSRTLFNFVENNGDHSHGVSGGGFTTIDGAHSHDLKYFHEHNVELPEHSHDIDYGIFLGPTPTGISVEVDGNVIPSVSLSDENVSIIDYLDKDSEGKVLRGQWHEIKITPNDLGRLVANVFVQVFIQSRGGGSY